MTITLRPARGVVDYLLVWWWRNHRSTRRWMATTRRISLREHAAWAKSGALVYIGVLPNGTPVGTLSLEVSVQHVARVSVTVSPRRRGVGYGSEMIRQSVGVARAAGAKVMTAKIRRGNAASVAAFTAAGFERRAEISTESWVRMSRSCD